MTPTAGSAGGTGTASQAANPLEAERARIKRELPGWDVWYVPIHQPRGTRWCGRPEGHPVSVAQGDSGDELIAKARAWAATAAAVAAAEPGPS